MSGRSGDFVTTDNTEFQGIGFNVAPATSTSAIFTNVTAHSRPLSITALPSFEEQLHYPFVHQTLTGRTVSQSWWHRSRITTPPATSGFQVIVYSFYMGPLGADRASGWTSHPVDVGFDDGWFISAPGGNDAFTLPDEQWLNWTVTFDASQLFRLTITDIDGQVYLDRSASLSAYGTFAFHTWTLRTSVGTFQNWLDDFQLDADTPLSATSSVAPATAIDLFR